LSKFLKIFTSKSELHSEDSEIEVFQEGPMSARARGRYKQIRTSLDEGFLVDFINETKTGSYECADLQSDHAILLNELVSSLTSEYGRAVIGLTILQLLVKTICPEQSIRLHKGGTNSGSFSWTEGISMRSLDKSFVTPVLRELDLLKINADGVMMTRTLAENYPYTKLYKAAVRGAKSEWIKVIDEIERGNLDPEASLRYVISLLINRSEAFKILSEDVLRKSHAHAQRNPHPNDLKNLISNFFNESSYKARAFEIVLHSAYQALDELAKLPGALLPLGQMRSANKKHKNIGDIEIALSDSGGPIIEAWDAKFGKADLREEVEELSEKLVIHPDCLVAGFITDQAPSINSDLSDRMIDIGQSTGCEISILSFEDWHAEIIEYLTDAENNAFHARWLVIIVECLAQERRDIAPIDEPCEGWLQELGTIL